MYHTCAYYNEYDSYIEITGYIGTDSNVIIPDYINGKPVTHVASNFQGNSISNIKTLKIGKNISYIENGAFSFGKGLESVYCDSIEYWLNITFNGYTANPVYCDAKLYVDGQLLEHVEIPSHITEIKPYTFILSYPSKISSGFLNDLTPSSTIFEINSFSVFSSRMTLL